MMPARPDTVSDLAPGLRRVIADNPSPMTFWGTNSYILGDTGGDGPKVVIDPGPEDAAHQDRLRDAAGEIALILVTHAHRDHSAGARALARATGAPVCGFGPPEAGRSPVMRALAEAGLAGGGEGVDAGFVPDRILRDGMRLDTPAGAIGVLWTPGHFAGHLSFAWRDAIFCGDTVMGWSSSLISPPDGEIAAFRASCHRLLEAAPARLHPGHGLPVDDPAGRIRALLAHRDRREAAILAALGPEPADIAALTRRVYTDIPASALPAAERNVLAHLVDLVAQNRARALPELGTDARFARR